MHNCSPRKDPLTRVKTPRTTGFVMTACSSYVVKLKQTRLMIMIIKMMMTMTMTMVMI